MHINTADFVISCTDPEKCPSPQKPEYAFIGRSNVGKSSLINMLVNRKDLAKTSGRPGKTQLINHFLINENWYLVDLPGYGYAKVSKSLRQAFPKIISSYINSRSNLMNLFVLIDTRLSLQKNDLEFMNWLGDGGVPFTILFTKADKLGVNALKKNIDALKNELMEYWEEMPPYYITSAEKGLGREDVLKKIEEVNKLFKYQSPAQP